MAQLRTVIPCVNYDDFLALTLPGVLAALPSVTVLTSPADDATITLAAGLGAQVAVTDAWYEGGPFNKALALNEWLDDASPFGGDDWVMVLDADIFLSAEFGAKILAELRRRDKRGLYSVRRRMCEERPWFEAFTQGRRQIEELPRDIAPLIDGMLWGFVPTINPACLAGYLQIWCPKFSAGLAEFPETGTAEGYDLDFALSFPDGLRTYLDVPEVLHLGPSQVNWSGRRSPRWLSQAE